MEEIKRQELFFDLDQSKARALIRIKEIRAGLVDVMLANVHMATDPMFAFELESLGYTMADRHVDLSLLESADLLALKPDLEYLILDATLKDYWLKIDSWILAELSKREIFGISESILKELNVMFTGKGLEELKTLKFEITDKINAGGMIDFDYWNMALKVLEVALAEKNVAQTFNGFLKRYKSQAQTRSVSGNRAHLEYPLITLLKPSQNQNIDLISEKEKDQSDSLPNHICPEKISVIPKDYKHLAVIKEGEFRGMLMKSINEASLRFIHPKLAGEGGVVDVIQSSEEEIRRIRNFEKNSELDMTQDEHLFKKEQIFLPCLPNIAIKYRLRKPRYHNLIKTIVEWNKYNSTHFNEFNPPPKIVDGYRFNLYYPDLIDKSKPPNYQISPDVTEETRILRFSAGRPYADVAFRIVNKPWDVCHRRGFRVDFENGHLRLYFGFKKDPLNQI